MNMCFLNKSFAGKLLTGTAALFALTSSAFAFTPRSDSGCNEIRFAFPPSVVYHNSGMIGQFTLDEILESEDVMQDVHALFNGIGGTWMFVSGFSVTPLPFVFKQWSGGVVPTIHVGWTSDTSLGGAAGTDWDIDTNTCTIREAHIYIKDPSAFSTGWVFGEPEDEGEKYYEAGWNSPMGRYFRISYLHEFIHAFGVAHSNDGLSVLNTSERGWANRAYGEKMLPFPDDVEAIRYLYPADTHRLDIGLLNTWYTPSTAGGAYPSANQKKLCKPSLGTSWGNMFDEVCGSVGGADGSIEVCPGDKLYTRVAVANYGTESLDVTTRLFFSEDDQWSGFGGKDIISPDRFDFSLTAASASQQGRVYEVPHGLFHGKTYRPIIRVKGVESGGDVATNWIPLRGEVTVKPFAQCADIVANPVDVGAIPKSVQ